MKASASAGDAAANPVGTADLTISVSFPCRCAVYIGFSGILKKKHFS